MKTKMPSLLFGAVILLSWNSWSQASAPQINPIYQAGLTGEPYVHNAPVLLSGNSLYGTTKYGAFHDFGSVYTINTDGAGFQELYEFLGSDFADGDTPVGRTVLSGKWLYGVTTLGGQYDHGIDGIGDGTVYAVSTNGASDGYAVLWSFGGNIGNPATNQDGIGPLGGLLMIGNTLYGTTSRGGIFGPAAGGTVFALTVDGTNVLNYSVLHNFTTADDGAYPCASLTEIGSWLYGTAMLYGSNGLGLVFAVNTNGDQNGSNPGMFANVYSFRGQIDQGWPQAGLLAWSNTLYGTTGGQLSANAPVPPPTPNPLGGGTVFSIGLDTSSGVPVGTYLWTVPLNASSGTYPLGDLCFEIPQSSVSPGVMLGTAKFDGAYSRGTILQIKTDGTWIQSFSFTNTDGEFPEAGLVGYPGNLMGNFYGTLTGGFDEPDQPFGGDPGFWGTIYDFAPFTKINITLVEGPIIFLDWGDPAPKYEVLQTAPEVGGPWSDQVGVTSPFEDTAIGTRFYRLKSNAGTLPELAPSATTLSASYSPASGGVIFSGYLVPNSGDSEGWFQYGPDTNYSNITPASFVSQTNGSLVQALVTGLGPGVVHFSFASSNSAGMAIGSDLTFSNSIPSIPRQNGAPRRSIQK